MALLQALVLGTLAQTIIGMRIKERQESLHSQLQKQRREENTTSTSIDVWMCDKMCMQCPNAKNVLIQRQKSGKVNVIGGGLGLVSFGWGMTAVTQLAGCNKIGFEFWKNRALEEDQPLRTDAFMGLLWVHSGLEKLQEGTNVKSTKDTEALEACNRLTDTYAWSALRGVLSFESSYTVQQRYARQCLSHSKLCGHQEELDDIELQTARWNPFSHESMCEPPPENAVTQEELDEFGAKADIPDYLLEDLAKESYEVQRIVMLKWPEEGSGDAHDFINFVTDVSGVVEQIPSVVERYGLDDECTNELSMLPIAVQKSVLNEFTADADDAEIVFLAFLKSKLAAHVAGEAPKKFVKTLNLDNECLEALKSQPPAVQKSVMTKFQPEDGVSDLKKAFLDFVTLAASVGAQIPEFTSTWSLDEDCLEDLTIQPPQIQKYIIENFKPTGDVASSFKEFVKSAPTATGEDGPEVEDTNPKASQKDP